MGAGVGAGDDDLRVHVALPPLSPDLVPLSRPLQLGVHQSSDVPRAGEHRLDFR